MLDSDTKRRIDTARDILVGKVPDPKSQVEQITLALIYKFMDDMDAQAEELGGKRKFFAGKFSRYGWSKLMAPGIGGHELVGLYGEGIAKMPENPGIPQLFRDIFKNAFLPYRDPETLKAFLKVINEFQYDHSERLGDAFEYLLSVLGSQGDAGQFRTPRHIIDFIVRIVDPKKNETILDPACGTAGFLISAYKHIEAANRKGKHSGLTPDEKKKLAASITGYDIDPMMAKLSRSNMYLHGFADPHIHEYDTLTSQERWKETADVILANPPFMSPKGGIKPHNRFGVQSKRSEVLFVDYMAEHLTPKGRAGIIVPEGIIFQGQTAYVDLRKLLVSDYLVAVVSLPAGVFNPYSGVKTSILILDKSLAKQSDTVGFFKVENDGFGLGAQRREVKGEQLTRAAAEIGEYLGRLRARNGVEDFKPTLGLIVPKAKIAENGDFNLSGERYREGTARTSGHPIVPLGSVAQIVPGNSPPGESYNEEGQGDPFYQGKTEFGEIYIGPPTKWTTASQRFADAGDILMSVRAPVGPVNLATQRVCIGRGLASIKPDQGRLLTRFAFHMLRSQEASIVGDAGAAFASINRDDIEAIQIPLPPLEVQRAIVAEIEGYQKVIDGARAVVDNYRPRISIRTEWPMVELGTIAENLDSRRVPITESDRKPGPFPYYGASGIVDYVADFIFDEDLLLVSEDGANLLARSTPIAFSVSGKVWVNNHAHVLRFSHPATRSFVEAYLNSISIAQYVTGSAQPKLNQKAMSSILIPLPSVEIQQQIVAEIEAEQRLAAANRELIARFEKKIQAAIARVWGEDAPTAHDPKDAAAPLDPAAEEAEAIA